MSWLPDITRFGSGGSGSRTARRQAIQTSGGAGRTMRSMVPCFSRFSSTVVASPRMNFCVTASTSFAAAT